MATRYGKLPTEILDLPLDEFSLNTIILTMGTRYEASVRKGRPMVLTGPDDDLPAKLDAIFSKLSGRKRSARK